MPTYRKQSTIPKTRAADLFDWHARPGAFHRLNPPWDPVRVLSRDGEGVGVGATITLEAKVGPVPVRWVTEHIAADPGAGFVDVQRSGPFSRWEHHHRFTDDGDDAVLDDEIHWDAPLGAIGAAVGQIPHRLEAAFAFRHRRTAQDLARHAPYRDRPRRRVLVSGASGLVGTALTAFLDAGGHEVVPLVRSRDRAGVYLSPTDGSHDPGSLDGFDAVVHLAGAPIASEGWSDARKATILDSRVDSTRFLVAALARCDPPPEVLVAGSAVGVYGDAGDTVCTEDSPTGDTFLAEVCAAWEAAAAPAADAGIRVVNLRTGLVLSATGGLLEPMLPLFRMGMGGPVGSGRQFFPWIHLDDLIGMIHYGLMEDDVTGPLNGTAPTPVPQGDFARALGRALGRPAFTPAPALAVRLALGRQRADELALQGQRAVPQRALDLGFSWWHTDLEAALRFELGRPIG